MQGGSSRLLGVYAIQIMRASPWRRCPLTCSEWCVMLLQARPSMPRPAKASMRYTTPSRTVSASIPRSCIRRIEQLNCRGSAQQRGLSRHHVAAFACAGHLDTVQLLLKRRADPRAANRKGEAPLAMAQDDAIREAVSAALAAPPPSAPAKQVCSAATPQLQCSWPLAVPG